VVGSGSVFVDECTGPCPAELAAEPEIEQSQDPDGDQRRKNQNCAVVLHV
jgi:hypothetical protein